MIMCTIYLFFFLRFGRLSSQFSVQPKLDFFPFHLITKFPADILNMPCYIFSYLSLSHSSSLTLLLLPFLLITIFCFPNVLFLFSSLLHLFQRWFTIPSSYVVSLVHSKHFDLSSIAFYPPVHHPLSIFLLHVHFTCLYSNFLPWKNP